MEFASSAALALQRIANAGDEDLILILSDINIWDERARASAESKAVRPDVPIIMITAYGDAGTKRQALERGAEALLTKPIDFALLRNEIESRVERTT
jgi:CheY-like chemotaxis protein